MAGKYGDLSKKEESCTVCPIGYKRNEDDEVLDQCDICERGTTTVDEGSTSCSACGIGQYGNVPGNCTQCPDDKYQSEKRQTECLTCIGGTTPNEQRTGCIEPNYFIPSDW